MITEYTLRCVECSCEATTWAEIPSHARSRFAPQTASWLSDNSLLSDQVRASTRNIHAVVLLRKKPLRAVNV
jgi:hypothetical protein